MMDKAVVAAAFNLWMDEYINHPERFEHEIASVLKHEREKNEGEELSYGQECAVTLMKYMDRIDLDADNEQEAVSA